MTRDPRTTLSDSSRRAVLVGVGTAIQDAPPGEGDDAIGLMVRAARAAAADAGSAALLTRVERIAVTQGSWSAPDAGRTIARSIGAQATEAPAVAAQPPTSHLVQLGIPQQTLIDQALTAIGRGEIEAALVVGGEAKARDDRARRAGIELPPPDDPGTRPDAVHTPSAEIVTQAELALRFFIPVQQYAAIDNALRIAERLTIAEHLAAIDALWARFDAIAATNPSAAFAGPRTAAQLRATEPDNRMLAFPYHKWHAAQWNVDQAAALLLCSERLADALGIDRERRLHALVSLESSHSVPLIRRAHLHRWQAMHELGRAAANYLGSPLAELDLVELYSCFPAAVRVQQRELELPLDGTPTLTGGMPFAGGPFNNFVFQATATMAGQLRARPGSRGMVTTVSGLLTKPGLAVWSTEPGERASLLGDRADAAAAATPEVDVADDYAGPAVVATYTVRPGNDGLEVVIIADTPDGRRVAAVITDSDVAERAMSEELIGAALTVDSLVARI